MSTTLLIKDENLYGKFGDADVFRLEIGAPRVTVRELIRTRVRVEVAEFNRMRAANLQHNVFRGLVQPADAEAALNGFRLRQPRMLDAQEQIEKALVAFERNGFLLLVNDRQIESLDEQIEVTPATTVTFLKLVMLVGG